MLVHKFHRNHGSAIALSDGNTVAYRRTNGYDNGITFSDQPLLPREIFLVEIMEKCSWKGQLCLGLTLLDPRALDKELPDFALRGIENTWVQNITGIKIEDPAGFFNYYASERIENDVLGDGDVIKTPRGFVPKIVLSPETVLETGYPQDLIRPMDIGSRVGVMFVPCAKVSKYEPDLAEMYFIINGEAQRPPTTQIIPYTKGPLHAVVDVYGSTKRVKIVQQYENSLQNITREALIKYVNRNKDSIEKLKLPKTLKDYLLECLCW